MPTFRSAMTEFSETGSPVRAATPAEITLNERQGSGCAAKACANSAAAIGLRHMLAVQTVTMGPGADIVASERTWFCGKRKAGFRRSRQRISKRTIVAADARGAMNRYAGWDSEFAQRDQGTVHMHGTLE